MKSATAECHSCNLLRDLPVCHFKGAPSFGEGQPILEPITSNFLFARSPGISGSGAMPLEQQWNQCPSVTSVGIIIGAKRLG